MPEGGARGSGRWRSLLESLVSQAVRLLSGLSRASILGRPSDLAYHAAMDVSGWELVVALLMMMRSSSMRPNVFHHTALAAGSRPRGAAHQGQERPMAHGAALCG